MARTARTKSRQPTYGAASRMVRLFSILVQTPRGRELGAIAEEMSVSPKTAKRYADVLVKSVHGQDGLPLVEVVKSGGRTTIRLRAEEAGLDSTEFQAASIFFASTALRSLRGTVVGDGADDVWDRVKRQLPRKTREALQSIERKFFYVPFAAKNYERLDESLGTLMRAVLRQEVLRLRYRNAEKKVHPHVFEPWTFVLYRDGLYLLGKSSRHPKRLIWLAIDRIESVERAGERFSLPSDFDPARHTEETFGIWSGSPTEVVLRLRGRAAEQIPERTIHPTQSFTELRGGAILMRFTVRGWQELAWWILSWGGDVEVLEPADLRDYVRRNVREAAALYAR